MRFRKKPIVIDAVQWWPPGDERHDAVATPVVRPGVGQWKPGEIVSGSYGHDGEDVRYTIKTLDGAHELTAGDYIITGVKGERYPCKPDIFAATYDEVTP